MFPELAMICDENGSKEPKPFGLKITPSQSYSPCSGLVTVTTHMRLDRSVPVGLHPQWRLRSVLDFDLSSLQFPSFVRTNPERCPDPTTLDAMIERRVDRSVSVWIQHLMWSQCGTGDHRRPRPDRDIRLGAGIQRSSQADVARLSTWDRWRNRIGFRVDRHRSRLLNILTVHGRLWNHRPTRRDWLSRNLF